MKKPILYFVLLLSTNFLFAQGSIIFPTAPVDNNGIVNFTFDLVGGGAGYNLSVEVNFNDGTGWKDIDPLYITGPLENVVPATGIALQWHAMSSFPGRVTSNAELKVTARHVCGTAFTFTYPANGTETVTYGTILKTYNEGAVDEFTLCWFDRNLGADPMPFVPADDASGNTDTRLYGDLFQWGRADEGHQLRGNTVHHSGLHSGLATTPEPNTGAAWDGKFITNSVEWLETPTNDLWQGVDGANNPCPPGWRVPTEAEINAERLSWGTGSQNSAGAYASTLKWPVGGQRRNFGSLDGVGSRGLVWSSSVSGANVGRLFFDSGDASVSETSGRILGMNVRCVRDI